MQNINIKADALNMRMNNMLLCNDCIIKDKNRLIRILSGHRDTGKCEECGRLCVCMNVDVMTPELQTTCTHCLHFGVCRMKTAMLHMIDEQVDRPYSQSMIAANYHEQYRPFTLNIYADLYIAMANNCKHYLKRKD